MFESHYTTDGKPELDQSLQRHITTTAISERRFEIPAGAGNYEVDGEVTINAPAKLVWIQPHMHYRGKDYTLTVVCPDGKQKRC